jgi:hypothetical protein
MKRLFCNNIISHYKALPSKNSRYTRTRHGGWAKYLKNFRGIEEEILGIEFYNDFEKPENAIGENQNIISRMFEEADRRERVGKKISAKKINALRSKIMACTPENPCGSAACHICSRLYRVCQTEKLSEMKRYDCLFVTLIYFNKLMTSKDFYKYSLPDIKRLKDSLRKAIKRAKINAVFVGAFDIHFDDELNSWIPHFHLITNATKIELQPLRSYFLRPANMGSCNGKIPKPMRVDSCDGSAKLFTYIIKAFWTKKIWIDSPKDSASTSKKVRLNKSDEVLAHLKRDEFGFDGLWFEYGTRAKKTIPYLSIDKKQDQSVEHDR